MAFTEEQRRKAQETNRRKAEERKAAAVAAPPGAVAVLERPAVEGEHLPSDNQLLQEFADFARILGDADAKKAQRDAAVDGIDKLMASLSPADYPQLVDHPVVLKFMDLIQQRREERGGPVVPGTIEGEGLSRAKKPWTMIEVTERANRNEPGFEWVDYVPRENTPVIWQGLTIHFFEDVAMRIPRCFLDVYNESRRQKRAADEHRDYLFAPRGLNGGSGPAGVATDPTIMAGRDGVNSRMLRGAFSGGMYNPGAGLSIEVPDADRPGIGGEGEEGEGEAA